MPTSRPGGTIPHAHDDTNGSLRGWKRFQSSREPAPASMAELHRPEMRALTWPHSARRRGGFPFDQPERDRIAARLAGRRLPGHRLDDEIDGFLAERLDGLVDGS